MIAIYIAIICYLALFISFLIPVKKLSQFGLADTSKRTIFSLVLINAVIAHFFSFLPNLITVSGFVFSFANTLLLSGWTISLLYLISSFKISLINIGLFIIPFNVLLLISYPYMEQSNSGQIIAPQIAIHILSSMIAFSLLVIAALQAITLSIQAKSLHKHQSNFLIQKLPAYFQMERVLYSLIDLGLIFLSIALLSGFFFLDDLFAQHLAHKTIFSIIAWLIFGTLSIGRKIKGWQSKTVIRSTIGATTLLIIGFLGSKFIVEMLAKSN